jgi:hypothetical protein
MQYPRRYPNNIQLYKATKKFPYPMNFTEAPSFGDQVLVNYNGQSFLQGLNPVTGPIMFPVLNPYGYNDPSSPYAMSSPPGYPLLDAYNIVDPYNMKYLTYGYYPQNYATYRR